MYILAIDTSGESCAVCISHKNKETCSLLVSESIFLKTQHAEALVPMLKRVLDSWGHPIAELSHCAVTIGPGSFTGVRIGLAAAKAVGLVQNIPVYGISTLAAYSAPYRKEVGSHYTLFFTIFDARHGAVFMGGYTSSGIAIFPPSYLNDRQAADILSLAKRPLFLTGSGASKINNLMEKNHTTTIIPGENSPPIEWVAHLSCYEEERLAPAPVYLREPDVKIPKIPRFEGFKC